MTGVPGKSHRGFDANDYYRYFLKRDERFVIRAKKNRKVIYNGKTGNIMEIAGRYKGNYCMNFKDKSGKTVNCKMSCIPVRLCEFPAKELTLVAVYGFGTEPMLLLSNLNLLATLAAGYIGLTSSAHGESIYLKELKECSKRIDEIPKFIFYALGYAIEGVLSMSRKGINDFLRKKVKSQQLNLFEHFKIEDAGAFVF